MGFMADRRTWIILLGESDETAPFMLKPFVKKGAALYRYDFRRPFREYVKRQGCAWVTPHVMRHTFASLLVSKGVSIYKVAVWMGDDVRVVQKTLRQAFRPKMTTSKRRSALRHRFAFRPDDENARF
jgi:site-specific recombinase XerD